MFFFLGQTGLLPRGGQHAKTWERVRSDKYYHIMYYSHFKRVSSTYVDCGTASILASRFGSRIVMVNLVILNVFTRVKSLTLDSRDWTY